MSYSRQVVPRDRELGQRFILIQGITQKYQNMKSKDTLRLNYKKTKRIFSYLLTVLRIELSPRRLRKKITSLKNPFCHEGSQFRGTNSVRASILVE